MYFQNTDKDSHIMDLNNKDSLYDGFTLAEAAEVTIYPLFSEDGGLDSERTYMKQVVQKYVGDDAKKLFTVEDSDEDGEDEKMPF